jgi:hypothetical protein
MNQDAGGHRQHPAPARRQHHRVVDRIKALLPQLRSRPPSRQSRVLTDRTTTIRASVKPTSSSS